MKRLQFRVAGQSASVARCRPSTQKSVSKYPISRLALAGVPMQACQVAPERYPFHRTCKKILRVEPRPHRRPSCQGCALQASGGWALFHVPSPRTGAPPLKLPSETRGRNFPCQAHVQPRIQRLRDNKCRSRSHSARTLAIRNRPEIDTISGWLV